MKTDVLIIGGGLTAYTAANEIIAGSALRVTMLSCGGGASPFIHGFSIPVEENDSQELLYADTMASGYGQSDPALVAALCRGSLELQDYFASFDLELDRGEDGGYRLIKSLGSSVARIAGIGNAMGPSMLRALKQTLAKNSRFEKLEGIRALDLIKDGSRVVGARCFDLEKGCFMDVRAGVVILATGGFGRLFPESTNSSDIGGDGCAMAYRAGAALTDMEFVQFEPSAALWPEAVAGKGIVTTMFYEGAVLRGNRGERFMLDHGPEAECVPKDVMSKCIYRQILDRGGSPHGGVWFDATAVPEEKWQTSYEPYLNRYLTHGIDLRKEPVEIAPAAHTTCGGVRIDEKCRTGVPGLLACGEVSGGLHGANRLGGNAGLETLVFGRIAGKTAVVEFAAVEEVAPEAVPGVAGEADYSFMHRKMQSAIRSGLNVIRSKESMTDSLEVIEGLLAELGDHDGCYDAFRLYNDLQTARLTLLSALGRKSSVGCHCREDSAEEDGKYRILVQLEADRDKIKYISI